MNTLTNQLSIEEQLTEIYFTHEHWHKERMTWDKALDYHTFHLKNGDIHVYTENNEVLGYYERYFVGDVCLLFNVYIKESERRGKVFKSLYRHFFKTMPIHIKKIEGEKQKLGGKFRRAIITKERYHGIN